MGSGGRERGEKKDGMGVEKTEKEEKENVVLTFFRATFFSFEKAETHLPLPSSRSRWTESPPAHASSF